LPKIRKATLILSEPKQLADPYQKSIISKKKQEGLILRLKIDILSSSKIWSNLVPYILDLNLKMKE
jgi:hypothetical protein